MVKGSSQEYYSEQRNSLPFGYFLWYPSPVFKKKLSSKSDVCQ